MSIQTAKELAGLRRAGRAVAATLREVRRRVRPGITTAELDRLAARTIARLGARPAPSLLYGFVATAGSRLDEIGRAVEREVGVRRFSVLGEPCGHGIGRAIHEEPSVPNVFLRRVRRWTEATADGSLSAHVEDTIAITRGRPLVLTAG